MDLRTDHAVTLALLLLCSVPVSAHASDAVGADGIYQKAVQAYGRSDWLVAAEWLGTFAERFPSDARAEDAHYYQGLAWTHAQAHMQAADAFGRYLERASKAYPALFASQPAVRATASAVAGSEPQADGNPELSPARRERIGHALFRRGEAAYQSHQPDLAEACLLQFVKRFPEDNHVAYALPYLGDLALRKQGAPVASHFRTARAYFQSAVAQFPSGPRSALCRERIAYCDQRLAELRKRRGDASPTEPPTTARPGDGSQLVLDGLSGSNGESEPVATSDGSGRTDAALAVEPKAMTSRVAERIYAQGPLSDARWSEAALRHAQSQVAADRLDVAAECVQSVLDQPADACPLPCRWHALFLQGQIAALQKNWTGSRAAFDQFLSECTGESAASGMAGREGATSEIGATSEKGAAPENGWRCQRCEAAFWHAESLFQLSRERENSGQIKQAERAFSALWTGEASGGTTPLTEEASLSRYAMMVPLRLGQLAARRGDWDRASRLVEAVGKNKGASDYPIEADYLMGRCHAVRGDFQKARQAYQRVLRNPESDGTETAAMAQWMIGESFLHQHQPEQALREFLRVEVLHDWPEWQAAALLQAGACHELLHQPHQAMDLYARVVRRHAASQCAAMATERLAGLHAIQGAPNRSDASRAERLARATSQRTGQIGPAAGASSPPAPQRKEAI